MYTINAFHSQVRDAAAPYGGGWQERESFLAEGVLRDLRPHREEGEEEEARRVVARYCVLRFVLLRESCEPAELVDQARAAAAEHLSALGPGWDEQVELRRLVTLSAPVEAVIAALVAAASAAEAAGHLHGAYAARRAAYRVARRRFQGDRAARVARGIAAFLRRRGEVALARLWERRAKQLLRLENGGAPSTS